MKQYSQPFDFHFSSNQKGVSHGKSEEVVTARFFARQRRSEQPGLFGGLCAGSYTLQATLPSGQTTSSATTSVNGQNQVRLDLRVSPAATTAPGVTGTPQPVSTSEPEMPGTGFSGLLLAGGALLGILLLLAAGARRTYAGSSPTSWPPAPTSCPAATRFAAPMSPRAPWRWRPPPRGRRCSTDRSFLSERPSAGSDG